MIPPDTPLSLGIEGMATRLMVATVAGAAVGLDRELREKPAGLRTCMLMSLTSAAFMVLTLELAVMTSRDDVIVTDPIRVIQAVTAGAAFIAAGTIISARGDVRGLTTGVTVWSACSLGIASGAGLFGLTALLAGFAVMILTGVKWLEGALGWSGEEED